MTTAEAAWRAARTQQLLDDGLERFETVAQVREDAKSQPWMLLNNSFKRTTGVHPRKF